MKVNFQMKGIIITARQKSIMEKKLSKMKRYLIHDEPAIINITLVDDTGSEKGGTDQKIQINVTFGKEKIFIEESDNRLMRAFAYAIDRLDRNLRGWHKKQIEKDQAIGGGRFEKVFGIILRRKKKK